MKQANVVSVRDISSAETAPARYGDHQKRMHVEGLLRRYPKTSDAETSEIINFLATGNHLDVGLVSGSDEFREKVARFRAEHARHFRLKFHEIAMFILAIGGPIAVMAWRYLG